MSQFIILKTQIFHLIKPLSTVGERMPFHLKVSTRNLNSYSLYLLPTQPYITFQLPSPGRNHFTFSCIHIQFSQSLLDSVIVFKFFFSSSAVISFIISIDH